MIIVFGSINMDIFMSVKHFPQPGEAVTSPAYEMSPGGKGANQALAAASSGAKVAMIGRVGNDGMGARVLNNLRRAGVMTSGIAQSEQDTGCAVIARDKHGENIILSALGANGDVGHDQSQLPMEDQSSEALEIYQRLRTQERQAALKRLR